MLKKLSYLLIIVLLLGLSSCGKKNINWEATINAYTDAGYSYVESATKKDDDFRFHFVEGYFFCDVEEGPSSYVTIDEFDSVSAAKKFYNHHTSLNIEELYVKRVGTFVIITTNVKRLDYIIYE